MSRQPPFWVLIWFGVFLVAVVFAFGYAVAYAKAGPGPPLGSALATAILAAALYYPVVLLLALVPPMRQRRRAQRLELVARRMGYSFDAEGKTLDLQPLEAIKMFRGSRQPDPDFGTPRAWNVMKGRGHEADITVFDYRYVYLYVVSESHVMQDTIVYFAFDSVRLPDFELEPTLKIVERIESALGASDINFPSHPRFSETYWLSGPDPAAIRTAFAPGVLEFFAGSPGFCLRAHDRYLVFCRHGTKVAVRGLWYSRAEPEEIPALVERYARVAELFKARP